MLPKKAMTALLLALCAATGGCNYAAFLLYLVAPGEEDKKTVEAEFKGLAGHSLAIVVFTDHKVDYEYPTAREHVERSIAAQFGQEEPRDRIKNLRVVDPTAVLAYQERNIHWDEMDKTQLGKALGAEYVLFVSLVEFTTHEPMSINLLRGMVTAEVGLYDTRLPERDARVWKGDDVRVVYPENAPSGVPGTDDRLIRQGTVKRFAERVVWKFYKHKEPVTP